MSFSLPPQSHQRSHRPLFVIATAIATPQWLICQSHCSSLQAPNLSCSLATQFSCWIQGDIFKNLNLIILPLIYNLSVTLSLVLIFRWKSWLRPIEIYLNDLFLFPSKSLPFCLGISAFSEFLDHELPTSGFPSSLPFSLCLLFRTICWTPATYQIPYRLWGYKNNSLYFPGWNSQGTWIIWGYC